MIRSLIPLWAAAFALAAPCFAQVGGFVASGGFGWAGPVQTDRPSDIAKLTAALNSKAAPSDDLSEVIAELQTIPQDLSVNEQRTAAVQSQSINKEDVLRAKNDFASLAARIKTVSCDDKSFLSLENDLRTQMLQVGRFGLQYPSFLMQQNPGCNVVKNGTAAMNPDQWAQPVLERADLLSQLLDAYNAYEAALKARQNLLSAKMHELVQGRNLTGTFIWFIVAFGVLALGVIFIVSKCFSDPLQEEWIGSGQITQFVTVMILLTVITMLGLSKVLDTDTLGTLLGGVAGYVLAQGVGRQAARDAMKQVSNVAPIIAPVAASPVAAVRPPP